MHSSRCLPYTYTSGHWRNAHGNWRHYFTAFTNGKKFTAWSYVNMPVDISTIFTKMSYGRTENISIGLRASVSAWNPQSIDPNPAYLSTPCLRKNCANFFFSELRQISSNFGNFWQKDGKEAKIMRGALNFHLT